MEESLCAHCKNCEEIKYDGFLCDVSGYIEDKSVEDGCDNFKDDGFDRAKYQKKPYEDYDKLVKFRNNIIDAIGIPNFGYTDDWLDKFVDSRAVDIIRKAINESTKKTSKHYMADLIATMAINGATKEELDRAIKYSAAVIDDERARKELGIDELEKKYMSRYPLPTTVEIVPEKEDSPIEYKPKTYEEELDVVDAFFDKYDELISTAQRNSLLGMLNDLDNAMVCIEGHIAGETESNTNSTDLKEAEAYITHVTLLLAQMWADENPDIELTCINPATGEETIINGKEEKEDV